MMEDQDPRLCRDLLILTFDGRNGIVQIRRGISECRDNAGTVVGETCSLPISKYTIKRPIIMSDDKINSG